MGREVVTVNNRPGFRVRPESGNGTESDMGDSKDSLVGRAAADTLKYHQILADTKTVASAAHERSSQLTLFRASISA